MFPFWFVGMGPTNGIDPKKDSNSLCWFPDNQVCASSGFLKETGTVQSEKLLLASLGFWPKVQCRRDAQGGAGHL